MTARLLRWSDDQNCGRTWATVADIPHSGTKITRGSPVLTVLAEGVDATQVEMLLRHEVAAVEKLMLFDRFAG